jgi:hypothetical protein
VQGKLRKENLVLTLNTACSNSGRRIRIEFDSDLNIRSIDEGSEPMLSVPLVNLLELEEPCIVDVF